MGKTGKLTVTEEELKKRFNKEEADKTRLQSTAAANRSSERVDSLILADDERPRMPFTKDKYIIRENPHLVQWERETRKFLRRLSPEHGHRITAVMVFEWATGLRVKDLMELETAKAGPNVMTWRSDLRKINKALTFYFGRPAPTWIMGRKVDRAYKVKPGYLITRHRPMSLELYAEYVEGSLRP